MSASDELAKPRADKSPECMCGTHMDLARTEAASHGNASIKIFKCPACLHELRVTAWDSEDALQK